MRLTKEIEQAFKEMNNFIGNSRFKISNESLTKYYNKIDELKTKILKLFQKSEHGRKIAEEYYANLSEKYVAVNKIKDGLQQQLNQKTNILKRLSKSGHKKNIKLEANK